MDYVILFVWLALVAVFFKTAQPAFMTTENGYDQMQVTKRFAFITFLPIIIFVCTATRRYWGDYGGYLQTYLMFPTNPSDAFTYIVSMGDCQAFYLFTYLIKILSGGNVFIYRFALALLQSIPFINLYRKYSPSYVFTVFLFVVTATPIAWMLNGVRQLIAAAIIYAATPLIVEKKYFKVILVILFASLFHQTAILMIPVVFIAQGEAWNWKTNLTIIGMMAFTVFFLRVAGTVDLLYKTTGYLNNEVLVGDDGVHPLRVLVSFVPVFLAYLGRRTIKEYDSPQLNLFVNMSVISFGIYLIAMVSSGILVGRVPLYMNLYSFILLPILFDLLFKDGWRKLLYFSSIGFYILYFYLQYGHR